MYMVKHNIISVFYDILHNTITTLLERRWRVLEKKNRNSWVYKNVCATEAIIVRRIKIISRIIRVVVRRIKQKLIKYIIPTYE